MTGDEVGRQRDKRTDDARKFWEQHATNMRATYTEEELEERDDIPGAFKMYADGSVWQNDADGVPRQTQPPWDERPDADVRDLRDRREGS